MEILGHNLISGLFYFSLGGIKRKENYNTADKSHDTESLGVPKPDMYLVFVSNHAKVQREWSKWN